MGLVKRLLLGLVLAEVGYLLWVLHHEPPVPYIDPDPWWGPGEPQAEDTSIRQFSIDVPKADVEDLKERLALPLRLTPALEGANFTYGFNAATLEAIVKHWRTEYDWKKREARLNSYPHFKTQIEGLDIHFMRAAAKATPGLTVLPLLLVHGWPGSFVEFLNILPLLTTPQEGSGVAFEVICPSIPGYGFSQASAKQGNDQEPQRGADIPAAPGETAERRRDDGNTEARSGTAADTQHSEPAGRTPSTQPQPGTDERASTEPGEAAATPPTGTGHVRRPEGLTGGQTPGAEMPAETGRRSTRQRKPPDRYQATM